MKTLTFVYTLASFVLLSVPPLRTFAQEAAPAKPAVSNDAAQSAKPNEAKPAPPPALRVVNTIDSSEAVVSMVFDETPLSDVIKAFRDATGANIISSGTNLQQTVSVRLDNIPWKKGLSSILEQQDLQLVEKPVGSGIFVVGEKNASEIPKITRCFPLVHARALDVAMLFKSAFGLTFDYYFLVTPRPTDVTSVSGVVKVQTDFSKSAAEERKMSAEARATATVTRGTMNTTPGTVTPFPNANSVIVTATEQQITECEKIIATIDKPCPQVYIEARFVEMTASASKKLGVKWDSLGLKDGFGVGTTGVKAGFEHNDGELLTHRSPATTVRDSSTILSQNEDPITHAITPVYGKETVNSLLIPDKILGADAAGRTANDMIWKTAKGVGGQLSVDDFRLAMNAFEEIDGVSIFSNPKIIVANERSAKVDMTTKEPNVEVDFQAATQQGQRDSVSTKLGLIPGKAEPFVGEAFFSYGITLTVTPRISSSGMITVDIIPSISELDSYFRPSGLDENQPVARYPIIKMQRMETSFTMASGTTAVIGGLTKTTEGSVDSGIPFLRSLPWIGPRLFGWKGRDKVQKEIIIFVTVGLADPINMREDVGLPKNAVLTRDVFNGKTKEPGDRTIEDILSLKDPQSARARHDTVVTEREAVQATPVAVEKTKP